MAAARLPDSAAETSGGSSAAAALFREMEMTPWLAEAESELQRLG